MTQKIDEKRVMSRIFEHYLLASDFAKQHDCQVASVSLKGSQNYRLATDESDVDTIAILVPSFSQILFKTPISQELKLPNGEHCVLKDIRLIYSELIKGSPNVLEIFCTDYYFDDTYQFQNCMEKMRKNVDSYAQINTGRTIDALCGMGLSKTGKNYHVARCLEMAQRLMRGESFKDTLISNNLERLSRFKKEDTFDEEDRRQLEQILHEPKDYNICVDAVYELKNDILDFFN